MVETLVYVLLALEMVLYSVKTFESCRNSNLAIFYLRDSFIQVFSDNIWTLIKDEEEDMDLKFRIIYYMYVFIIFILYACFYCTAH